MCFFERSNRFLFHLLALQVVFFMTSCSTGFKMLRSSTDKVDASSQSSHQVEAGTKHIDPMHTEIPLSLVKGYEAVNALVASKDFLNARAKLAVLQQQHPQRSGPSYRIARIYWQQKNYIDGLKAVEKSIQINPSNYYAINLKAMIYREQGQFAQSKSAYLDAIEQYPDYENTYLNFGILADIYLYDLPLALQQYERYLALHGKEDKKVSGWVIDLKRRMPKDN